MTPIEAIDIVINKVEKEANELLGEGAVKSDNLIKNRARQMNEVYINMLLIKRLIEGVFK